MIVHLRRKYEYFTFSTAGAPIIETVYGVSVRDARRAPDQPQEKWLPREALAPHPAPKQTNAAPCVPGIHPSTQTPIHSTFCSVAHQPIPIAF